MLTNLITNWDVKLEINIRENDFTSFRLEVQRRAMLRSLSGALRIVTELSISYNPSILHCRRGCDFGTGRVNNPDEREISNDMCKRYASELYMTSKDELGTTGL